VRHFVFFIFTTKKRPIHTVCTVDVSAADRPQGRATCENTRSRRMQRTRRAPPSSAWSWIGGGWGSLFLFLYLFALFLSQ